MRFTIVNSVYLFYTIVKGFYLSKLLSVTSTNVYNPMGCKRTHTLVAKSRGRSSRCCGLSSVEYHGWEGKKKGPQ